LAKWLAPILGGWALIAAASVGAVVWAQKGDGGTCDRGELAAALGDGIRIADQQDKSQFDIVRPTRCGEEDIASVLQEVTRAWHMMPGGTMMREASHTPSTP
jgi:hypothetical protein